jgi:plastocyanin
MRSVLFSIFAPTIVGLALGAAALTSEPAFAAPAADEVLVVMSDGLAFEPSVVTVPVGSTVTWSNQGSAPHTVTGERFDSGSDPSAWIMGGGTFSVTFTEPGTYTYVCIPHQAQGMAGTVVVQ